MTTEELAAMREELIRNHYPIEEYDSLQPDYNEQIVYHYTLFLLYEAEYCDCIDADTRRLLMVLEERFVSRMSAIIFCKSFLHK